MWVNRVKSHHGLQVYSKGRLLISYYNLAYINHVVSLTNLSMGYVTTALSSAELLTIDTNEFDSAVLNTGAAVRRQAYQVHQSRERERERERERKGTDMF